MRGLELETDKYGCYVYSGDDAPSKFVSHIDAQNITNRVKVAHYPRGTLLARLLPIVLQWRFTAVL